MQVFEWTGSFQSYLFSLTSYSMCLYLFHFFFENDMFYAFHILKCKKCSKELFRSLMCLCFMFTFILFDILPLIYRYGLGYSYFLAVWSSRPGVHFTCCRPGFDLQVFKLNCIHGYIFISPHPCCFYLWLFSSVVSWKCPHFFSLSCWNVFMPPRRLVGGIRFYTGTSVCPSVRLSVRPSVRKLSPSFSQKP